MDWRISTTAVGHLAASIPLLLILPNVWRHRGSIGWLSTLFLTGAIVWTVAFGIWLGLEDANAKWILGCLVYVSISMTVIGFFGFSLGFVGYKAWLTKGKLLTLLIVPILSIGFLATNDLHHLFFKQIEIFPSGNTFLTHVTYNLVFYVYFVYHFMLVIFSIGLIVVRSIGQNRLVITQTIALLFSMLLLLTIDLVYVSGYRALYWLHITSLSAILVAALVTWGIVRQGWMGLPSEPRAFVVESLDEPVFVVDGRDVLEDINPAGLRVLGVSGKAVLGLGLARVLTVSNANARVIDLLTRASIGDVEVIKVGNKSYQARCVGSQTERSRKGGRLIVLRDITPLANANQDLLDMNERLITILRAWEKDQIQIIEQERNIAIYENRVQIGHELHAGLAQSLLVIRNGLTQLDDAIKGDSQTNGNGLARKIHDEIDTANKILRDYLAGLQPARDDSSLDESIRSMISNLQRERSALQVELTIQNGLENTISLDPTFYQNIRITILYVIREALTNIAKHANASEVWIKISMDDLALRVAVSDNGKGVLKSQVEDGMAHFGVRMMRERVENCGGSFSMGQRAGGGTECHATLPLFKRDEKTSRGSIDQPISGLRVALVDDHKIFLVGLRNLFVQRGVNVVGIGVDATEAIKIADESVPDVMLIDQKMPGCEGPELIGKIKAKHGSIKCVILTASENPSDLEQAIIAGADGYILKDLPVDELLAAVDRLVRGESILSRTVGVGLIKDLTDRDARKKMDKLQRAKKVLTEREREVLDALLTGERYKKIASSLNVNERTIKRDVKQILSKLKLASIEELSELKNPK